MKISDLLGKELTGSDGRVCGYVRGVYAYGGKIEYLACADGDEREFDARLQDITEVKGKLIFEDNKEKRKKSSSVRLGIPAFTSDGNFAGFVKDIVADRGEIKYYYVGRKKYSPDMLCIGDVILIKQKRILKDDVVKNDRVILKKGTELDDTSLKKAEAEGEYVQAQLKSI